MLATISRKRPHLIENHMLTQIKSSNFKKYIDLGIWGLKTSFGPLGPKRFIKSQVLSLWFQFPQKRPHLKTNSMSMSLSINKYKFISKSVIKNLWLKLVSATSNLAFNTTENGSLVSKKGSWKIWTIAMIKDVLFTST